MSTLILCDGKNALYRYGFAHRELTNSDGKATGAIYGVLGALIRLKKIYPDGQFVICWDGRGKSWRHNFFPGYKSNRTADKDKPPEVIAVLEQQVVLKKILDLMRIPQLEVPTVEADDLIGMAAIMHRAFGLPVVVYSSDKDFMQLMEAGVTIIKPVPFTKENAKSRLEPETPKSVLKRFGCTPAEILKVRAFAGDSSDAIPVAIPGIGEKRAMECIRAGADPSKEKPVCSNLKYYGRLVAGWADVRRNYRLMQIAAFHDPALFGKATVKLIKAELDRSAAQLRADVPDEETMRKTYWEFVKTLADLDLLEALENRFVLWAIQRIK